MAYIGNDPSQLGDFVLLDSITTSATASYTLQKGSANFTPTSANHLIVSLNGVTQSPQNAYTVSGSTLTFSQALTNQDVIDYIICLGTIGYTQTPADDSVTGAKLSSSIYREGILVNSSTLTTNTTIASGERGLVAGNYAVNSGVTLTINGELVIV